MASLKEVKGRINSINGTLKITSAMKMVASAKLHKAQEAIENMLPYERRLHNMLTDFLSGGLTVESPYTVAKWQWWFSLRIVACVVDSTPM